MKYNCHKFVEGLTPSSRRFPISSRRFSSIRHTAPPNVFDSDLRLKQRARAAHLENSGEYDYVRDLMAGRLVDRLMDVSREFPKVLDFGAGAGSIYSHICSYEAIPVGLEELVQYDSSKEMLHRDPLSVDSRLKTERVVGRDDKLPFANDTFDAVLSSLTLGWINDLPGALREVKRVLKPDCPFLGCIAGGSTLEELRSAFVLADQERRGGIGTHISPMVRVSDVGDLLSQTGFKLLTIDNEKLKSQYPSLFELMEHLKGMGETNSSLRREKVVPLDTFLSAASIYEVMYSHDMSWDGHEIPEDDDRDIFSTLHVIYFIGWKEGEGQTKPKERGSQTRSLQELGDAAPLTDSILSDEDGTR